MARELTVSTPILTFIAAIALAPLFVTMALLIAGQTGGFHLDNLPSIVISSVPHNLTVVVENEPGVHVLNFPAVQPVLETNPPARTAGNVQRTYISGPVTAYGDLSVAQLTPVFQVDAVYSQLSLTSQVVRTFAGVGGGSVTNADSSYVIAPGSDVATIQSRKRILYHPGEGIRTYFSARFVPNIVGALQFAGMGHGEDGLGFGCDVTGEFGIYQYSRGKRTVYTLTVTTASTTTENAVIMLAGVAFPVAVTNSGNTRRTAYEISQGAYAGWQTQQIDSTVIFSFGFARPLAGPFSATGTTMVATFTATQTGVAPIRLIVPQTEWNGYDTLNGTGVSGMLLDPFKYNAYQVSTQYLGTGAIYFFVETPTGEFALVHTLRFPNSRTQTTFGNPSFPFLAGFRNISMVAPPGAPLEIGSFGGFVEGKKVYTGARYSIDNALLSTVDSTAYYVLFSFANPLWFQGRTAQGVLNIINIGGSVSSTQAATLYVFRSVSGQPHNLNGNPNFQPHSPTAAILVDKSATTFTPSSNDQLVWTGALGTAGFMRQNIGTPEYDDLTLQPGDMISVCARTRSGAAANYVIATVDIRQDY